MQDKDVGVDEEMKKVEEIEDWQMQDKNMEKVEVPKTFSYFTLTMTRSKAVFRSCPTFMPHRSMTFSRCIN